MGLKFRRGSTAQQSGSLAFGEPYVNTTLGTLVVGGATGDIVLSSAGTGSTGNFGAISGSGLDITGNANIGGNLTVGGQLQIGDQTSDTVNVVASLSSSLIPQTTNAFDLGSATKIWKDLYISTGSIKFVAGTTVVKELSLATLTSLEAATGSSNVSITNLNTTTASLNTSVSNLNTTTASLLIETANLESFSSSALTRLSALEVETSNLESFTSSINTTIKNRLDANTVVSGSSQVIGILSSLNTYTGSNDTTNTTQTSRLDQLSTASGSAITRLTALEVETSNLETFTSSINTTIKTRLNAETVVSGSSQITYASISSIPSGIVSGSSQVDATATTNWSTGIKTRLDANTVISGSSQVTLSSTTGYGTVINQNLLTTSNVQHASLGIGMAASGTAGRIDASGDVVAFSTSDKNFKENITPIENAIEKIRMISGNTYDWKSDMKEFHGFEGNDVGVIAQEIEAVLPQLVTTRETGYKAVKYDKLVALLIEGIKEQQQNIDNLTIQVEELKKAKGL